jgi:hypothetical protein
MINDLLCQNSRGIDMDKNIIDMTLENMKFSYSSISSFNTCAYGFYLTYIEYNERVGNFFSDFGSFSHLILEKYFSRELEIMELASYYEEHYAENVVSYPPNYPVGMADKYYNEGLLFFENFSFDRDKYEVLSIEDKVESCHNDIKLVIKPDLILKDKESEDIILYDYKTSNPYKNGKEDKKKMDDYKKQMYLYSYFINHNTDKKINKIKLWFIRSDKMYEFDYIESEAEDVVNWFYSNILNIQLEENYNPCDIIKNKYFCENLCSVKNSCKYVKI